MGLPDVEPLQAEVMGEIQRRAMQALAMTDPQQLLKNWVPWGAQGMEAFSNIMRAATGTAGSRSTKYDEEPPAPRPKGRS